jgi:hypothetical protein
MARPKMVKKSKWVNVEITAEERAKYYQEYFDNGRAVTKCPPLKAAGHLPLSQIGTTLVDSDFDG